MSAKPMVLTLADLRGLWPDLRDAALVALDLREEPLDWSVARLDGAIFLGCSFPGGVWERLATLGAALFSPFEGLPFQPYRSRLYSYEELTAGHEDGVGATLDTRISSWFVSSSSSSLTDLAVRALHDATVDAAIARFVDGRRVVGVMGGHAPLVMPPSTALLRTWGGSWPEEGSRSRPAEGRG